jgi:orotate phosphoribosyltransferase
MIFNKDTAEKQFLLQINAIKLNQETFSWASGWKSPIYCDNRLILPFPARNYVRMNFRKY